MINEINLINRFKELQGIDTLANMFISDVIDIIKKQPKMDRWIPCSERIPETKNPVLVYAESTTISCGTITVVGACDNGFWFFQNGVDTLVFPFKGFEVIAWQPLPEPYGGK